MNFMIAILIPMSIPIKSFKAHFTAKVAITGDTGYHRKTERCFIFRMAYWQCDEWQIFTKLQLHANGAFMLFFWLPMREQRIKNDELNHVSFLWLSLSSLWPVASLHSMARSGSLQWQKHDTTSALTTKWERRRRKIMLCVIDWLTLP